LRGDHGRAHQKQIIKEMNMKSLFATALVALSLLAGVAGAQAAGEYPDWARDAFEQAKQ
jgi:hypothetical protein